MAKFKVGDKVRVRRDLNIGECYSGVVFVKGMNKYKGEIIEIEDIADDDIVFLKDINFAWLDEILEEVKEDKMEKTFREVIADIKEGEVWESKLVKISSDCGEIEIEFKRKEYSNYTFCKSTKYKLKRKEYTFEEAFKAYEEGKEIESVHSGYRYKLKDKEDLYIPKIIEEWVENTEFDLDEIRGKWYIND